MQIHNHRSQHTCTLFGGGIWPCPWKNPYAVMFTTGGRLLHESGAQQPYDCLALYGAYWASNRKYLRSDLKCFMKQTNFQYYPKMSWLMQVDSTVFIFIFLFVFSSWVFLLLFYVIPSSVSSQLSILGTK